MQRDTTTLTTTDRPLKVMHVIARLNIGGPAVYVIQLVDRLNASGCQAQIVCGTVGKDEGDMRYLADQKHLPLTVIPSLGREISPISDLATIYHLWRLMRHECPDVVHTHTAKAGFVGRIAAWLARIPVIVHTFHGHVFAGYFGKNKTRVFIQLERLCARLSTRIITLSALLKRELADIYHIAPASQIEIIELGFELDELIQVNRNQSDFRIQQHIPADVPLVGIVGRLVPIKNHDLFLRAAKKILETTPDAHFAIVGDGERRAELEGMAHDLGIAEHVHFAGWITDTGPVYAALNVVVLCSHNEGLPVSLIEAMATGVPVVATAVGGVHDLLEEGRLGAMVPPGDTEALAQAIIKTLHGAESVIAARAAVIERYSIQRSAERTQSLYRTLLHERGRL